jgi:hypothetical protein
MMSSPPSCRWYADRAAWRLIGLRYLPLFAGLNLAWESAQWSILPLLAWRLALTFGADSEGRP